MNKLPCGCSNPESHNCCTGTSVMTPRPVANRPGLDSIAYRAGTHSSFFQTMLARLSSEDYPAMKGLTTREGDDFSIALLDAWATVADVLTFYQERIANEGYLRTATERRSTQELARLTGYAPRPGVAASAYLAFTLEDTMREPVEIPPGVRTQSIPAPGEMAQSFETSEKLIARRELNLLRPRLTQKQNVDKESRVIYLKGINANLKLNDVLVLVTNQTNRDVLRVESVEIDAVADVTKVIIQTKQTKDKRADSKATDVNIDDNLKKEIKELTRLFKAKDSPLSLRQIVKKYSGELTSFFQVLSSIPSNQERTDAIDKAYRATNFLKSYLQEFLNKLNAREAVNYEKEIADALDWVNHSLAILEKARHASDPVTLNVGDQLSQPGTIKVNPFQRLIDKVRPAVIAANIPPSNRVFLNRDYTKQFTRSADVFLNLVASGDPQMKNVANAFRNNQTISAPNIELYVMRASASLFGHNAIRNSINANDYDRSMRVDIESLNSKTLYLDMEYNQVIPSSLIVLSKPNGRNEDISDVVATVSQVASISRNDYGISGKSTQIGFEPCNDGVSNYEILTTKVFIQSEKLILAEEPLTHNVSGNSVELEELPDGIESGRWMIVSGELDIPGITGVRESELVMVANVERVDEPGSKVRANLTFANTLKQNYKRDTVRIYGNVVRATQGETVIEVLGSGDATKASQRFSVKRPPITFLPAATPSGSQTTLQVRVNDLLWNEAVDPTSLGSTDQGFVTRRDDDGKTSVLFGNGKNGLRLPTGIENVTAQYRTGLGKSGNVKAGQISLLAAKPSGVKEVTNPLAASGGANPDGRDLIRMNAPLAVLALDRLVSVKDYEAFCRMFAGIGKAQATRISNRSRQVVYITIAGIDDILIDTNSDLYRSLVGALHRYGDPYQPLQVAIRDLIQLVISAKIRIDPRYLWQKVEQRIRRTLLDVFSFERRQLGQDVTSSEVISTIQRVDGVQYVDLEVLNGLTRELILSNFNTNNAQSMPVTIQQPFNTRISVYGTRIGTSGSILPAQIAYLTPEIPQTLILNLV